MNHRSSRTAFAMGLLVISTLANGQLTIDATHLGRARRREPTVSSGGGIGRKLPLKVSLRSPGSPPNEAGMSVVEFTIANTGKKDVLVPISVSPGDIEPDDAKVPYADTEMSVYATADTGSGAARKSAVLRGGAHLYGSAGLAGTSLTLAPGEEIRVLASFKLPALTDADRSREVLVGHVALNDEHVSTVEGKTRSDFREIGSADSDDYEIGSPLRMIEKVSP
ncbi:MAG TPA: hypothetical protein VJO35_09785 [Terriglobales bacterium]|nr:hypothetical protein [Terriglobales bacterium]